MNWINIILLFVLIVILAILLRHVDTVQNYLLPAAWFANYQFYNPETRHQHVRHDERIEARFGRNERTEEYYYHGSSVLVEGKLEPRPSKVIEGDSAVFATNDLSTALMFIGTWSDADISYGTYNGVHHAVELHPGAFDLLKKPGYIYLLDPKYFKSDPRLGLQEKEFISCEEVPIVETVHIEDAFTEMQKLGVIKFVIFSDMMNALFDKKE